MQYQHGEQTYTYVTNLKDLQVGNFVVVPTAVRAKAEAESVRANITRASLNTQVSQRLLDDAEYLVKSQQRLSLALVVQIDDVVDIQPDSDVVYKWVVAKVDLEPYGKLLTRNKEIEDAVADAYKANLRKSFAERILGDLPAEQRNRLLALTGSHAA